MLQAIRATVQLQKAWTLHPPRNLKAGDTVVYHLTDWQKRHEKVTSGFHQYSSSWSVPHLVVDLYDLMVMVRPLHSRGSEARRVPIRLVRKLAPTFEARRGEEEESRTEAAAPHLPTGGEETTTLDRSIDSYTPVSPPTDSDTHPQVQIQLDENE
eukprot:GHVS01100055.1.p1 GENE.GHVS01100055.1~~GHVS01100055.1.p1  ORF type:complete len:155 (+),score=18.36 GHVS01100055.1:326-790(+)